MDSPGARLPVGNDVPANNVTDQWKRKYVVEIHSLGEPVSSQAQCQWRKRQPFDLDGPEIASVGWMSGCERSRADDLPGAQRLVWESPQDGRAEFRQA